MQKDSAKNKYISSKESLVTKTIVSKNKYILLKHCFSYHTTGITEHTLLSMIVRVRMQTQNLVWMTLLLVGPASGVAVAAETFYMLIAEKPARLLPTRGLQYILQKLIEQRQDGHRLCIDLKISTFQSNYAVGGYTIDLESYCGLTKLE